MLTLFDYLPSQNGWKVRQILHHLRLPHETEIISIFEGQGRTSAYLAINPSVSAASTPFFRDVRRDGTVDA